jgi:hypothetical protein
VAVEGGLAERRDRGRQRQGYVRRSYCAGLAKKRNPDAEIVFDEEAAGPAVTPDT